MEALWREGGLEGGCARWVGGHAAKVLAALVRCGSASVRSAAAAELAPLVRPESVEAWAERFAAPVQPRAPHGHSKRKKGGAPREQGQRKQQPAAVAAPLQQRERQPRQQASKKRKQ